jgi:hypothetical protein
MRSFLSFFVISALIFVVVLPPRAAAQDEGSDPTVRLQALLDSVWDATANFRAHIESKHNVTLTKDHAGRTLQALYPKTMKYVLDRAQRRWGMQITELDGGIARITIHNHLVSGGMAKDGGITFMVVAGAILFVWGVINLNQFLDDIVEDQLVQDCMAEVGDLAGCQEDANALTDNLRYLEDPTCFIPGGPCLARILNEIERIREHRLRPEPLNPPGMMRVPPPAGMTPYEVGRHPCPGGSNHEWQTPTLPQAPPGSNDTHGSFDGTITVTTSPSPCT